MDWLNFQICIVWLSSLLINQFVRTKYHQIDNIRDEVSNSGTTNLLRHVTYTCHV